MQNARVALFAGVSLAPYLDDTAAVWSVVSEFLGHPEEDPGAGLADASGTVSASSTGTAVILFADIVDSTALTERMGDAAFHERSVSLHTSLRRALADAHGRVVEGRVLGDGLMAIFASAKDAIQAALRCHEVACELDLQLHVGLHAGDVILAENDVHGGTVNIASRISALSAPGEVLVSDTVRSLARTSAGVAFEDRGEHALKGVADPQRVYAVHAQEQTP